MSKFIMTGEVREKFGNFKFFGVPVLGITVSKSLQFISSRKKKIQHDFKSSYNPDSIAECPRVKAVRALFDIMGIGKDEPTAVENITKLLYKGGLPNINSVVDSCNIASLATQMPIGVFDKDKINGDMTLAFSKGGEIYDPIGKETETLESGILVLSDDDGIIARPMYKDSKKTMITLNTKNIYVFTISFPPIEKSNVSQALSIAAELIIASSGGQGSVGGSFEFTS